MTRTLFVDKSGGTFADSLVAFGLAVVVRDVVQRTNGRARHTAHIADRGAYYQVDCGSDLDDTRLGTMPGPYVPAKVIRTAKNAAGLPHDLPPHVLVDYEEQRDKRAAFFELRNALPQEAREARRRGESHPALEALRGQEPHPDWDVFRAINPAGLIGYNKLMTQWWAVQGVLPQVLTLLRDFFAQTPNDLAAAVTAWKRLSKENGWDIPALATAAQIYNPSQGKGQNHPKAEKLHRPGKNLKSFWLLEWLKAVGFYRAALTKQLRQPKGVKRKRDRKTYVLAPAEIELRECDRIMKAFRGRMIRAEFAISSDVLAAIRYTQALLEFTQQQQGASLEARLFELKRPNRVVAGFYSAFYKDLGNAVATMNLSFIRLPGWIRVKDAANVAEALEVLDEHEAIVRQFDESHSDDHGLLLLYRDFLSGNDLWPFFAFCAAYSSYIIGQRERRGGYARQFSVQSLGRLIMSVEPKLSKVLETPGFQNIAYAIRQSTVVQQYRKAQGDRRYNVRYGLGLGLARKANYAAEFMAELSDFLHKYNAENAQVMENRPGPYRRSIQTTDIDEIAELVDSHGAPLVCNLLVAYGYARSPRPETSAEESATQEEREVS